MANCNRNGHTYRRHAFKGDTCRHCGVSRYVATRASAEGRHNRRELRKSRKKAHTPPTGGESGSAHDRRGQRRRNTREFNRAVGASPGVSPE